MTTTWLKFKTYIVGEFVFKKNKNSIDFLVNFSTKKWESQQHILLLFSLFCQVAKKTQHFKNVVHSKCLRFGSKSFHFFDLKQVIPTHKEFL
jgi:hypothetical protein